MTKRGTYKGRPTITLKGEFSDLTFGLTKARLLLANLDAVRHFVEDFSPKPKTAAQKPVLGDNDILDLPPLQVGY